MFLLFFKAASSQVVSANDMVKLTAVADTFMSRSAVEKLYFQFDKPYYAIGDTIWFKAYLFNAAYLTPSLKSGIIYVELANDSNKVVLRIMLPVAHGLSWGNIAIDAKTIPEGGYTLRAYSNWMRNFGEAYVFKQRFYFTNASEKSWLVNSRFNLLKENGVENAKLKLQFSGLNNEPEILKDLELRVSGENKTWYKSNVQTKLDGSVNVEFALKNPVRRLVVIAQEKGDKDERQRLIIPVVMNRPENTDLQFMPEGGTLVAGLPAHIGFKAIGEDGKAVNIEGVVYNNQQKPVASFRSVHSGMGAFDMIPAVGETYTANINLANGAIKTYSLPAVQRTGTSLKVDAIDNTDSLAITIAGVQANGSYYLMGQANEVVCYGAIVNINNNVVNRKIPSSIFPTGIARFTLLDANRQPLNERMVFINHHDFLKIEVQTDKPVYKTRDSIALKINVEDKDGHPASGSFSIAVTDDSQVKHDNTNNILSNLLLTSNLKGNIEDPGYYFKSGGDSGIKRQLDNLLLTQGWVGYTWKDVLDPTKAYLFEAEKDFVIRGSVLNAFDKPVAKSHVLLFSKKPPLLIDSITNNEGRFSIRNIIPLDTPIYILQARNKRGKGFNVDLKVDEFKPPWFALPEEATTPWYVNSDNSMVDFVKGNIDTKNANKNFEGSGHILKEVKITAKKFIKGSQNLNGPGNADVVIDEKDLENAGKKTILDLLKERVEGFHEGFFLLLAGPHNHGVLINRMVLNFITDGASNNTQKNIDWYFVKDRPIKIIVDGVSLSKIYELQEFRDIKDYLTTHLAEEVRGIEVNVSSKYTMKYIPMDAPADLSMADVAFIEITTRAGSGPVMPHTPGTYLYKPIPFSLPKQFYQPKYTVNNKDTAGKDSRSTIFWKPNLVTDKEGKATLSFYSSDKTGTYTIVLEGADANGNIGSYRSEINISGR